MGILINIYRTLMIIMILGSLNAVHDDAKKNDIVGAIDDGTWAICTTLLLIFSWIW